MSFRQKVEENAAVWLLGTLLTGFLAGIAVYRAVQEIAALEPISKSVRAALESKVRELEETSNQLKRSHADSVAAGQTASADLRACNVELGSAKRTVDPSVSTSLSTCRSELLATRRNASPPSVVAASPNNAPLRGRIVCIEYRDNRANDGNSARRILTEQAVHIQTFAAFEGGLVNPDAIVYTRLDALDAALRTVELLRGFGFTRALYVKGGPCDIFVGID